MAGYQVLRRWVALSALAGLCLVATGCQPKTPKEVVVKSSESESAAVEPLKELSRTADGVTVRVYTGGCTEKAHFSWKKTADQPKGAPVELILMRNTKDKCYAHIPDGMVISFSHGELGVKSSDSFVVGNPVVMPGIDPDA